MKGKENKQNYPQTFAVWIGILFVLLIDSCMLTQPMSENGVYWETPLKDKLSAGLSYNEIDHLILAGDQSGTLYAIDDGSGMESWERSFSNEIITGVYAGADSAFCLSRNTNLNQSMLRRFSLTDGVLSWETNFTTSLSRFFLVDDYAVGSTRLLIPSGSNIIAWYITNNQIEIHDYSSQSQSLKNLIAVGSDSSRTYYVVDSYGTLLKLDSTLSLLEAKHDITATTPIFSGALTTGSTTTNGDFLFIGTSNGIKMFALPSLTLQTTVQSSPVGQGLAWDVSQEKLFAILSTYPNSGVGCYDPAGGLQEKWVAQTSADINFSPLDLSLSYNVLLYIDDYGYINVIDSKASSLISQTYIGSMDFDGLKFAKDSLETRLYIPLSTPSKVIAYSLDYLVYSNSSPSGL